MIRERNFYDSLMWPGSGIHHEYEVKTINIDKLVIDHTTGLMWQQGGSDKDFTFSNAQEYVNQLNRDKFTGFNDWRLPTLEEAMSLMEPKEKNRNLYIDPAFDKAQSWIWTADQKTSTSNAWLVHFDFGSCAIYLIRPNASFVRAVRSEH